MVIAFTLIHVFTLGILTYNRIIIYSSKHPNTPLSSIFLYIIPYVSSSKPISFITSYVFNFFGLGCKECTSKSLRFTFSPIFIGRKVSSSSSSSSPVQQREGHRAPGRPRAGVYAGPGAWATPAGEGVRVRWTRARSRASRAWARARSATVPL